MKRLVFGTANFNNNYGSKKIKIRKYHIKKLILPFLKKNQIKYLDTSLEYNQTSKFLKSLDFKKFEIITKFKVPKKNKEKYIENLESKFNKSLNQFNKKVFYGILLHNTDVLKSKYKNLLIKKKKLTKKIGISIYDPSEINYVLKYFTPDIIQAPINLFNQNFLNNKIYKILKKKKILLQARSIFLQGYLLNNKIFKREIKNKKLLQIFDKFNLWCTKNKISKLGACISFIKNTKGVSFITFGADSLQELVEVLKHYKKKKKFDFRKFSINDKKLTDLRKWNNKKNHNG